MQRQTTILTARDVDADAGNIASAAAALRAGGLVAFATETVYGLGADAGNASAVAAIYEAKDRPKFNPLISHVPDVATARQLVKFIEPAEKLAEHFWPGALTLVLERQDNGAISDLACAGLETAAIRVPSHPVAHALLAAAGRPIAAPSANRSGHVSPTIARHVAGDLDGRVDIILDAGPCGLGLESSIVCFQQAGPMLLREGGITREAMEAVIGPFAWSREFNSTGNRPIAPGQLSAHYAPAKPLRLNATEAGPKEALLAFGSDIPAGAAKTLNLSPSRDLPQAAANLFAMLRELDDSDVHGIAAMSIPEQDLGRAINDRLRRAAHA